VLDTEAMSVRLEVCGLSRSLACQLSSLVERWVLCEGAEHAVKRVKSIKVNLLRHHAGLPHLDQGVWMRYRGEVPRGPFGALFRMSKDNFRAAWNAVMLYTNLVFNDPEVWATDEQWENLLSAITREPVAPSALIQGLALVHKSPLRVPISISSNTGSPLIDYQARDGKRAPLATGDEMIFKSSPEPNTVITSLRVLSDRPVWATEHWDILSGTLVGLEEVDRTIFELNLEDELKSGGPPIQESPLMGSISLIQEGGYKLRFAANPHRVYQAALQPLGLALFRGLRKVRQDCTFDHDKGVRMVQEWLRQGKPAVSMDLSNATDRAPLDLQLEFLHVCGVPTRWLQFLKSTCQGTWRVNRHRHNRFHGTNVHWTVGSPLGLYPTFAAFALWHHSVVQAAFVECGWPREQSQSFPYVILGDDLVIMDREVASTVRGWFESWGMKVSELKSLDSDSLAEFAGRVISSSDVVRGFKWKGTVSDESFVDFARQMGPGSLIMMRPRHKRVLAYIGDLPEPYGLGWNPYGIPLEERLTPLIERVWERDERYRTFSSRAERSNKLLYPSIARSAAVYGNYVDIDAATSDQEAEQVVRALLPGLEQLGAAVWPNLLTVALERGVPEEVENLLEAMLKHSSQMEDPKKVTTLVILERKIRAILNRSRR